MQAAQTRLAVAEQSLAMRVPSPQTEQALQAMPFVAEQGADRYVPAGHVVGPEEHCWHTGPPAPAATPSELQPVAMSHTHEPGAGPTHTECGALQTHTALPFTGLEEPAAHAWHLPGATPVKPNPGEPPRQPHVLWPVCVLAAVKAFAPEGQAAQTAAPAV